MTHHHIRRRLAATLGTLCLVMTSVGVAYADEPETTARSTSPTTTANSEVLTTWTHENAVATTDPVAAGEVRTSPYYPQSNGKIERWHRTLKADCIRPGTPLSLEDARRIVPRFVTHYNTVRLHSALSYITPWDRLQGREQAIWDHRDQKLEQARNQRKLNRQNRADYSLIAQPAFSI